MYRTVALFDRGIVKYYNPKKGYGFIEDAATGKSIFVNFSGILGEGFKKLARSTQVEFKLEVDESGRSRAVNVCNHDGSAIGDKN